MPGCCGCGRGKLVAPSSLRSCWTCCAPTPPLPGRETEQPLSSLFLATCFAGSNNSAQSAEGSAPSPERVRGSGWPGSRGLETWRPGSAGVEEAGFRAPSSQEELRTQTPGLSREKEARSPDTWVPG